MSPTGHVAVVHVLALLSLAATAAGAVASVRALRWRGRDALGLLLLTALALALRLATPSGPYEQNLRSGEVFLGVDPRTWHYGVALPLLWRDALRPVLGWGLPALFALQACVGALVPAALVLLGRTAGLDRRTSALAGLLLALAPVHVRFSPTDAQGIPETLLLVLGLAAWVRHARAPSLGAALAGGAGVGLAAITRPEALLLAPLVPLAMVAAGLPVPWRDRRTAAGVAWMGVLIGVHVAGILVWNEPPDLHRAGLASWPSPLVNGPRHYVGLDPAWTSPAVIAATLLGVALGPVPWRQRLAWAGLAVLTGAFLLDATWAPVGRDLPTFARHQLRSLPWFAVLAALGLAGVRARLGARPGAVVAALVLAAATWDALDHVGDRYTMQEEARFLVAHLPEIPDGCTLVTWYPPLDRGLVASFELSRIAGRDHRWLRLDRGDTVPTTGCVVWYRPANCAATTDQATPGDTAPCAAFEAAHALAPLAEARLVARGWQLERYTEDPVRVGLYRVGPLTAPSVPSTASEAARPAAPAAGAPPG